MNFDWDLAKTFMSVCEEGSFSGAARALGQAQPTIGRQVAALERSLNVTLFERTGRSVELTSFGMELLEHVRVMGRGADMVSLAAMGQSQRVEGQVRITASELIAAFVLPPIVDEISTNAPLLELDIVADNGVRNLVRREADIAIRHAMPDQPNLFTRRVSDEAMRFYASPQYVAKHGEPTLKTMSSHQIISFVETETMLNYLLPAGLRLKEENFRFTSSSQFVALELTRKGMGVMVMSDQIAAGFDDLTPVLGELPAFEVPTWLVAHGELKTSRRVRIVFDHLAQSLS